MHAPVLPDVFVDFVYLSRRGVPCKQRHRTIKEIVHVLKDSGLQDYEIVEQLRRYAKQWKEVISRYFGVRRQPYEMSHTVRSRGCHLGSIPDTANWVTLGDRYPRMWEDGAFLATQDVHWLGRTIGWRELHEEWFGGSYEFDPAHPDHLDQEEHYHLSMSPILDIVRAKRRMRVALERSHARISPTLGAKRIDIDYSDLAGYRMPEPWTRHPYRRGLEICREHDRRNAEIEQLRIAETRLLEAQKCAEQLKNIEEGLAQFNINVNHSINFGEFQDKAKSFAASIAGFQGDGIIQRLLVGLPVLVAQLWRQKAWQDRTLAITAFVNTLGLATSIVGWVTRQISYLWKTVQNLWRAGGDPVAVLTAFEREDENMWSKFKNFIKNGGRAHSAGSESPGVMVGLVGGLIALILVAVGLKSIPNNDREMTAWMTRFGLLGRCITSAEKVVQYGEKFAEYVMRLIRIHIFKQDPAMVTQYYEISRWCDAVSKHVNSDFESTIRYNGELKVKIDALLHEGDQHLKLLDKLKIPFVERTRFTKMYEALTRMRSIVASSGAGCADLRVAPTVVHFVGDSGCGKSTVMWPLFMDVLAHLGVTTYDQAKEAVYFRYAADDNKNWDGYHQGSQICVIDDIFTKRDTTNNPNKEVDEVIRMANTAYWALPMAALSDKGTVHFGSKLIVWTSNRADMTFPSRTNPEAIVTRVGLRFKVTAKPAYAHEIIIHGRKVNGLLRAKINSAYENGADVTDFVDFQELDPLGNEGDTIGPMLTYEQVVKKVTDSMDAQQDRFGHMQRSLEKRFKAAVQDKQKPPVDHKGLTVDMLIEKAERSAGITGAVVCSNTNTENPVVTLTGSTTTGTAQGLWTSQAECTFAANGLAAENQGSYYEWLVKGRTHRSLDHILGRFLPHMTGIFSGEEMQHPMSINAEVPVEQLKRCVCVEGDLTCAEQQELVALLIRHKGRPSADLLGGMTWGNRIRLCETHDYSGRCWERRLTEAHSYYIDHEAESALEALEQTYIAAETQLTVLSGVVIYVVGFAGLLAMSIGASMWQETIVARTRANMAALLEEELQRSPVGKVQSRSEQTPGRSVGRVEAKTRGYGHTPECMEELAESLRSANAMNACNWGEQPIAVALARLEEDNEYQPWVCACADGRIQAVLDQNAAEVSSYAFHNLYKIEQQVEGNWEPVMNIVFLQGRIALANKHLRIIFQKEKEGKMRITNVLNKKGLEFRVKDLRYAISKNPLDTHRDLMLIEFPRKCQLHRSILSKFVTTEDASRLSEFESVCITGHVVSAAQTILRQYFATHAKAVDGEITLGTDEGDVGLIRNYIKYKVQTGEGDCGSLVTAFDKRINNKIIGIHAGGMNRDGYAGFAQPVTQEVLHRYLADFRTRYPDSTIAAEPPVETNLGVVQVAHCLYPKVTLEGEFVESGAVQCQPHRNYRSRIRPSPIHGSWEATTAPAVLRPITRDGVTLDPMKLAMKKVEAKADIEIDSQLVARCVEHYMADKRPMEQEYDRVFSLSESIQGVQGDDACPPINRKSSCGFGWPTGGGGKKKYLGSDEYIVDHPEVVEKVEKALAGAKEGKRLNSVFVDTLKDERRPLDRVAAAKTRLFCAGEMIFTLVFRMYFMGWAAHMWTIRGASESCVGINPFGSDWHFLALDLKGKGKDVVAGDFSNYDGTLRAEFLWAVFDIIERFYANATEEERQVRRVLWTEVVNSWHVNGNTIYMWTGSNPSGCPVTSLLNSVAHSLLARYVFSKLSEEAGFSGSLEPYHDLVVHRNYGDDDVWNIAPTAVGWLNQHSLTTAFAEVGMTYTGERKGDSVPPTRTLAEVEFLKRGFRFETELARWVGPLRLETIREMPLWIHDTADQYTQTAETFKTACEELALHDHETYTNELVKMHGAANKIREVTPLVITPRHETLLKMRETGRAQLRQVFRHGW